MSEKQYDVVVCGAGVAGVAAAIAAARSGCKTALIEKQCILGGLATSGLIYVFLPLCDGNGHQVIHGIPEELNTVRSMSQKSGVVLQLEIPAWRILVSSVVFLLPGWC